MTTSKAIAVLCALCALSAMPAHARRVFDVRPVGADDHPYCLTCQVVDGTVDGQRYQLIRGVDEVKQCVDKHYCDCVEHKQMKCEGWVTVGLAFVPEKQACGYMFSCADWLSKHPTASTPAPTTASSEAPRTTSTSAPTTTSTEAPTTASSLTTTTPNPTHPYCMTCQVLDGQRYQLIRGENEVQDCVDKYYCDCQEHKQMKCEGWVTMGLAFVPEKQACGYMFSCADWLSKHPTVSTPAPTTASSAAPRTTSTSAPTTTSTEAPTTASSLTTRTPNPTHPYCRTCQVVDGTVDGQRYQLIRGADELKQCADRQYCDCQEHTQMKCEGWVTMGLAFVPEKQACGYMFSCADWLSKHPTASTVAPTTTFTEAPTSISTEAPTTPSPLTTTTPNPSHPYCLACQVLDGQRYQLIRGADEVQECVDKYYCDCQEHKQMECEGWVTLGLAFVPEKQTCGYGFNCADWLSKHTNTSTEAPATTSTAGPTPNSTKVPTTDSTAVPMTTATEIPTTTSTVAPTTTTTQISTTTSTVAPTTTTTQIPTTSSSVAPTQYPVTNPTTTSTGAPFRLDSVVICRS